MPHAHILERDDGAFVVRAASGNELSRVCNDAESVLAEIKNWRS